MATDTIDKITNWAAQTYSAAPAASTAGGMLSSVGAPAPSATPPGAMTMAGPSGGTGMLSSVTSAPATSTTTPAPTTSAPKAGGATPDIANWYRSVLGRDADQAGVDYWTGAIKNGMGVDEAYSIFQKSAADNKEIVKNKTLDQASTPVASRSADAGTIVDDWGRNVLGRGLTQAEQNMWNTKWSGAKSPEEAQAIYQQFLEANKGGLVANVDLATASQMASASPAPGQVTFNPGVTLPSGLTMRAIDPATETVRGQLGSLLAEDSPVLQQARAEGMRTAFDRGLGNSTMAASAGADAMIRAATGIATTDSGYYNKAADYDTAAKNEMFMYDRDMENKFKQLEMQYGSEAANRMMQFEIAKMGDATTRAGQSNSLEIAKQQNETTKAGQAQQFDIAKMQNETNRINAEMNQATSRYNTDAGYKQAMDTQRQSMANNIIANMEMSPDRKAAMLESLGFGTSAKSNGAGQVTPGTGLAGAVYVIDSVGSDLNFAPATPTAVAPPAARPGLGGMIDSVVNQAL